MERTKLSSLRSTNSTTNKQPYLDYFTSSDLDGIAVRNHIRVKNNMINSLFCFWNLIDSRRKQISE